MPVIPTEARKDADLIGDGLLKIDDEAGCTPGFSGAGDIDAGDRQRFAVAAGK